MDAMQQLANKGAAQSYGEDSWTACAGELFREMFEKTCEVFFAFNGTPANSLPLGSLASPDR